MTAGPLLYRADTSAADLRNLALGAREAAAGFDLVDIAAETGGTEDRELAIPFLPEMDSVVVDLARLRLRAQDVERDVTGYVARAAKDKDGITHGITVTLSQPGRLAKILLDTPTFADGLTAWGQSGVHVVVRPAEPGQPVGPPVLAHAAFNVGKLYPQALAGLGVAAVSGGGLQLSFPKLSGTGWLIQFAKGDDPTGLQPQRFTSAVRRVVVAAALRGVTLVVRGETVDPSSNVVLWSYPSPFLPNVGAQVVDFTPIARKLLAERLAAQAKTPDAPTLPLRLRFSAASGGRLAIEETTLDAHYEAAPIPPGAAPLQLRGSWTRLALAAPAGRRPFAGGAHAVATHLGRELNGGSAVPSPDPPGAGVRVDASRWAAAAVAVEPPAGAPAGATVPLVSARVYLRAPAAAEVALELRRDVAGAPGPSLAPPVVRQLAAGTEDWVEFQVPAPVEVEPGPAWVALRTTRGEARWFGEGPGAARISVDQGRSWGDVDPRLAASSLPLAQLFHAVAPSRPVVQARIGAVVVADDLLAGATPDPSVAKRFTAQVVLPAAVLDALGRTVGSGRRTTELLLLSRAAVDLALDGAALSYEAAP